VNIGEMIGIAGGVTALGTAVWKAFDGISDLRVRITRLEDAAEDAIESNVLGINGVRERLEHTNKRTTEAAKKIYVRVNRIEDWLIKNTQYQPSSDR
jgi:hypothetical protein